ncbi:MAG: methionine--tRNA ligase [Desulfobacteraceae bacterium]|nr:methionine--tRNA ligase [Pseudomonadota bacterium]MCG2753449.1 methionine--tRNA ligase [Desulfobacteraceae bacterium]
MTPSPFYITTPIYYVNARPHLGHAYTTIIADVVSRFHTMKNREVYFLTGTDEHGDKIARAAKEENLSPKAYADRISDEFKALWPKLNIAYHQFIRTTDPHHVSTVQKILQKIHDAGDIYFSEYEGKYCFGCERFITEHELVNGKCPDHGTEPETIKESNYFFRMGKYQAWLMDHIQSHPDFIRPKRYRNEVLAFLREPLEDLCISRPKTRLQWGITLPFDANYVTYVWFDALINYISALDYPNGEGFQKYWPVVQHITAKDILKPHGIYWPIMLKAAGIPVYQHLNVHGYWNIGETKMSKSIGNVVDPLKMVETFGLDAFRFFLLRDMVFGLDSNFSDAILIERVNSDLANDFGNLFSRVIAMAHKYFQGIVPEVDPAIEEEFQLGLAQDAAKAVDGFEAGMEAFEFHKAIQSIWEFISRMNKYVDVMAPWDLAKQKSSKKQLEAVLYNLLEGLRVIAGLVYPIMPDTAEKMRKQLGLDAEASFFTLDGLRAWNVLKAGTPLEKSITLFPRIDTAKFAPVPEGEEQNQPEPLKLKPEITYDQVEQMDLRVGRVRHAEKIPKAKKLLKLEIDLGEERTVVAGIAGSYSPEDMIGKQVIVVANLKPAKLMGVLSNGMVLAAATEDGLSLATVDAPVKPGTPLR